MTFWALLGVVGFGKLLCPGSVMLPTAFGQASDFPTQAAEPISEASGDDASSDQTREIDEAATTALSLTSVSSLPPGNFGDSSEGLDVGLRFSFERAPWREVITWIAGECDLALQYEALPTGSFSYNDPRSYSQSQAIDRINLFLLPQGFALVRSGQLLAVINLGDPRSMQQLDAMAELVPVEQLAERNRQEVVKCMFALTEISPQDAVQELEILSLMTTPKVFNKSNQLMITDTVAKLLQVRELLSAFKPLVVESSVIMESFALQHVSAEDVLLVARPHLGLATGEMIGIDVSLSTDLQGEFIFVTGVEDKVRLVENLVKALDQATPSLTSTNSAVELRTHLVSGGNLQTVFNVLKTLLAGKSLRLSADEASRSIVALASPEVQAEIAQTVAQLQAAEAEFEVIPLQRIDPYLAISLLEEMLSLPGKYADPEDIPADTPKLDADPGNRQLFVRAKPYQIEQIKKIVQGLDAGSALPEQDLRVLPLQGAQALEVLETATQLWRKSNPIILLPHGSKFRSPATERTLSNEDEAVVRGDVGGDREARWVNGRLPTYLVSDSYNAGEILAGEVGSAHASIRCQVTPSGLLLESDDTVALKQFEEQLRAIAGPLTASPSPPIVFYLRYTKPDDALRLLAELLDGGESAKKAQAGKLVRGYVASPGSYLGSIVTARDGTATMMAGTLTVVADSRLNRLIAQGTSADIDRIEGYLKIIDKDRSITAIETYGSSHLIELKNSRAEEVATAIREAYASRIAGGNASGRPGAGGGNGGRPVQAGDGQRRGDDDSGRREEQGEERRGGGRGQASQPVRDLEPKLTVAVHAASNSLIVTAPEQLFKEVEQLARLLDTRSEQTIEVLAPENSAVLQAVLQPESVNRNNRGSTQRDNNRAGNRSDSARMLEMLRGRGR